jgi:NAD+ diphosphatase
MKTRNVFAGPYLERAAQCRSDSAWFDAALADERSRVAPVWNSRSLIGDGAAPGGGAAPRAALLSLDQIPPERRNANDLILLGSFGGSSVFAYEIEGVEPPASPSGTRFEDLRIAAVSMPADEAGLLSYARALITWRAAHRFCGRCAAPTVPVKAGHVLMCSNPACRHEQFPRIDPAIIVLISDGPRVLLGRQASWPVGRYSTIAGFVEPGESLEDAVYREVLEETGVQVDAIEYHSSQPWPFPSSLMLGFSAHATTHEVHLRDQELEDARWFTRSDIAGGSPLLPPPLSISYRLIENWFDAGETKPLREVLTPVHWPPPPR